MTLMMIIFIHWESTVGEFTSFYIFGAGQYFYNVLATICLVHIAKQRAGQWIPFSYGFYGIGAISSPVMIGFLGISVYYIIAIASLIIAMLCSIHRSPA